MRQARDATRMPRPIGMACAIVLAALILGAGTAQARQRHHHRHHAPRPPAPAFTNVTVQPDGATHRLVTVETSGPPLTWVDVCDLTTSLPCVGASPESSKWVARLPAQDPAGPYAIGLIGHGPGGYVTGFYASNPPAPIPPLLNIG